MNPEDIANCQFVPISSIEKALNYVENEKVLRYSLCNRDLLKLQTHHTQAVRASLREKFLKNVYHKALHHAIYTHDWNKLLYFLKRAPIWKQDTRLHDMPLYIRSLTILLMYHPSAKAQDLLRTYFHMVCTRRSEREKKALMKIILTLPETIRERLGLNKLLRKDDDDDDDN